MSKRKRLETSPSSPKMDFFSSYRQAPVTQPETLISFYEDTGTDSRGRRLTDVLRWGVNKLESSHDYIQTLFPLPERSGVNDRAPVIDKQVFDAFHTRAELRDRLRDAFKKMLWFYGFELRTDEEGKLVVKKGHNYQLHSQNWLARFDHNHLRITRIIRCLRVLDLEDEALAFYDVISTATTVSSRSRMYWGRAAHRPLNIRPDIDDDDMDGERIGPKFLREFEQLKKEKLQANQPIAEGESTVERVNDDAELNKVMEDGQLLTKNGFAIKPVKVDEESDVAKENGQAVTTNGPAIEPIQDETIKSESDRAEENAKQNIKASTENGSAIEPAKGEMLDGITDDTNEKAKEGGETKMEDQSTTESKEDKTAMEDQLDKRAKQLLGDSERLESGAQPKE